MDHAREGLIKALCIPIIFQMITTGDLVDHPSFHLWVMTLERKLVPWPVTTWDRKPM